MCKAGLGKNLTKEFAEEAVEEIVEEATEEIVEEAVEEVVEEVVEETAEAVVKEGLESLSAPSSKALRQNLIEAGVDVPSYPNAAHHIVAGSSPKAEEARAILQKFGIDINDAANGVFLPTAKDAAESAYHPGLHTDKYYRMVTEMLSQVTSKEDVLDILSDIAEQLANGTFQY